MIQTETRKKIHLGINYVMTHMPIVDSRFKLGFQKVLDEAGVLYSTVSHNASASQLEVVRTEGAPLHIRVATQGPNTAGPAIGQLLVSSSGFPEVQFSQFKDEADKVVRAFEQIIPASQRQVLSKDAAIHELYGVGGTHAFQSIWETLLGQDVGKLDALGRMVLGGGLRLVLPASQDEADPVNIELKIESFLRDSSRLYLEVNSTWPRQGIPGGDITPTDLIDYTDAFINDHVVPFLGAQNG